MIAGIPPSIASRSVCTRWTVASRAGNWAGAPRKAGVTVVRRGYGADAAEARSPKAERLGAEGAMNVDRQMQLVTAGAVDVISEPELRKKLESGRPLRVKLGIDPTSRCRFSLLLLPAALDGEPDKRPHPVDVG